MRTWLLVSLLCVAAGCGDGRSVLFVTVDSAGGILHGVDHLSVTVKNRGQTSDSFTVALAGAPVSIPPATTFSLGFDAARSGSVSVLVDAVGAGTTVLSSGQGDGMIQPGQRTNVSVFLPGAAVPDLGQDGTASPPDWIPTNADSAIADQGLLDLSPSTDLTAASTDDAVAPMDTGGWGDLPSIDQTSRPPDQWVTADLVVPTDFAKPDFAMPDLFSPDLNVHPLAWTAQTSNTPTVTLLRIWGSGNGDVYIVGQGGGMGWVLHSVNNGASWKSSPLGNGKLFSVWGSAANDVYVAGELGIFHSYDGGQSWGNAFSTGAFGIWGNSATDVYASGTGKIYHSTDGKTWVPVFTGDASTYELESLWGSGSDLFCAGYGGTILHATSPNNWARQTSGAQSYLYSIWGSSALDVYAVGDVGTIVRTTDRGMSWSKQQVNSASTLFTVWGSGPTDIYAVGFGGTVVHTSGGGAAWTKLSAVATTNDLYGVWGTGLYDVFIVGDKGTILHGQ